MSHTLKERTELLKRVRRLKGQVESVERALEDELGCSTVLHRIAACRGAISGLMARVVEGHIRDHLVAPETKPSDDQLEAAEDLMAVVRSYLK
ncbi:metal/formaldehyde-sensitive transcriptional repressor [Candidatus Poribacteria bacterium]|nr:metal/formaldehyde-sensitive transcriptional repressor [Candidatus Poribacteria bacterium]